jgi:uncharacterized integral membrane protein
MNELTEGYVKEELTMDATRANVVAVIVSLPILFILAIPFILLNRESFQLQSLRTNFDFWARPLGVIIVLVVMAGGIVVHEVIHGVTFSLFAKRGFKSIKFGILTKTLTPYCHCKEPLRVWQYILSTVMPAVVLGLIPSLIAMAKGNIGLMLFGIFFTIAAAGDFIIIYLLRKQPATTLVQDHPEKIGCYIFKSPL